MVAQSQSSAKAKIQAYVNDIRGQLADGGWHLLNTQELSIVHSISNNMPSVLRDLKCIESRKSKAKYKPLEYRRLPGLAMVSIQAIHDHKRKAEVESNLKQQARMVAKKQAKPEPVPVTQPEANECQYVVLVLDKDKKVERYETFTAPPDMVMGAMEKVAQTNPAAGHTLVVAQVAHVLTSVVEYKHTHTL